ncbi:MAG TPA: immunoglobulin domain-containing protein [Phycisphaerae bacterium]|nr:immunoglobulin domain-containing protein [Phycisphaerae bacterium]HRR84479.1 immunoglobulin domain-containing protein [Phycisphaerae bacterium]
MSRKLHSQAAMCVVVFLLPVAVMGEELPPEDSYDPGAGYYSAGYQPLMPVFEEAAAEYDVPLDLLLALGKVGSAFEDRGTEPTIEGGYGIMALRDSEYSDSLKQAARLLKLDSEVLKIDAAANIRGAAAVLDRAAKKAKIDRNQGLRAWLPVVIEYAGLDAESSKFFARGIYQRLQNGFSKVNSAGEVFEVLSQSVGVDLDSLVPKGLVAVEATTFDYQIMSAPGDCGNPDYALATWDPAPTCNYSTSVTNKDTIVIHVAEGSAAGTISWFKNCSSGVAAHYVMDEAGAIWQMVCERHVGYHIVCYNSRAIGIEHEGYTADPSHPEAMYQASANWARDVCNRWGIPKQKARSAPGIVGHADVSECVRCTDHMDPGHGWDWGHYMALVNQAPDPITFIVESRAGGKNNANYSEVGSFGNSSGKSTVWDCTSGIGSRYAYMNGTNRCSYSFTPTTSGTYRVYVTWCTSANATQQLEHIVTHAGGSTSIVLDTDVDTNPCGRNNWNLLGEFVLNSGVQYSVTQTSQNYHDGMVLRADAVKWEYVGGGGGVQPPTITQHPAAQSVCPGSTAVFSVTATGEGTLTYQWQKNQVNLTNGGHYSGVTTEALTVSNADGNDAANYRCVVSNAGGSTTSNAAGLTLKAATTITQHPSDQTVATGGTANFSVAAAGDGALTYQWQKNQVNLSNGGHYSGVTTATLTVSNADSNDAASYRCVVTAGCGIATSNSATLTVTTGGTTIFFDNFDSYANQTAFTAVWPISVSPGGTLSTALYFSSPKSIYIGTSAARNQRNFTETTASDAVPIVWKFRLYDNNTSNLDRQWCELLDASPSVVQLVALGKSNVQEAMRTYYAARVAYSPGPGWVALNGPGAPTRSVGWHELKAVIKSTTIDFYVDGVLAKSGVSYANSQGQFSFDRARLGSGYSSTSLAYYDDYSVVSGQ